MLNQLTQAEVSRYSRHLMIPEVGMEGQLRLKNSSVLIVGTGGLGSPISLYLAAAGIGKIGLVDFDVVDESNLQRQIVHGQSEIGNLKVDSAAKRLSDVNPLIQIETFSNYLSAGNISEIAEGYQIIVDGSDNFSTRYLLNDYCVFENKPYVYGSIFRFEGQVSVFDARLGPCYRCIFPEPPPPGLVQTCGEGGVFGVLPGTIGTFQASEVIKLIINAGESSIGKLFLYDALDLSLQAIQLKKNPACPVCGQHPTITTLVDTAAFCANYQEVEPSGANERQVDPSELESLIKSNPGLRLIDVRNPIELQIVKIPNAENIPYEKLIANQETLDKQGEYVFICRNGVRSGRIVQKLSTQGYPNVYNLRGGTNRWVEKLNPDLLTY